jgi:putative transposase
MTVAVGIDFDTHLLARIFHKKCAQRAETAALALPEQLWSLANSKAEPWLRRSQIFIGTATKIAISSVGATHHGQHLHPDLHPYCFAVQERRNLIRREHNDELQTYITGIISRQGQKLIAINNMPDHFHILIGPSPNVALSDVVRQIEAGSSGFINDRRWVAGSFPWQEGFGAFSYSHSQLCTVIRYIQNQQNHHHRKSFSQEYVGC